MKFKNLRKDKIVASTILGFVFGILVFAFVSSFPSPLIALAWVVGALTGTTTFFWAWYKFWEHDV